MTALAEFKREWGPTHGHPLLDAFERLWRALKYPVTWFPKHRRHYFLLTVGERASATSELSAQRRDPDGDMARRRGGPQMIYNITIPASWATLLEMGLATANGHIVLECVDKPYGKVNDTKRYSVRYLRRSHGGKHVYLAQGTLAVKADGTMQLSESRDYSAD